jgi:hypothetical protein
MNTRNIENRLMEVYSDRFRRIWVQYCVISKRRSEYRLCITIFPIRGQYTMLFSGTIKSIDYDTVRNIIEKDLEGTD